MNNKLIRLLNFLKIIPFYYITKSDSIYLYIISLSLYNIYSLLFSNVSIYNYIKDIYYVYVKKKIFTDAIKKMVIINIILVLITIVLADITNIVFNIEYTFVVFITMTITISIDRIAYLFKEYVLSFKYKKLSNTIYSLYHIMDILLFILIAYLSFKIFKLPNYISISLLYLSKMISFMIMLVVYYFKSKDIRIKDNKMDDKNINYSKINKEIFKVDNKIYTLIVRNVYFYISIIVIYLILKSRYNYPLEYIYENIAFMYFYSLNIVLLIIDIIKDNLKKYKKYLTKYIYKIFKISFLVLVVNSVLSYPIFNILFRNTQYIAYFIWVCILGLFLIIYDELFDYIKNKKVLNISLYSGLLIKAIFLIPLVDSVYRMGYNLIFGDIISTILGFVVSIIINYIYIRNVYKLKNNKYLEKIFRVIYDNMFLLFVLLLLEFFIPIKSNNILVSIFVIVLYSFIGYMYYRIKRVRRNE